MKYIIDGIPQAQERARASYRAGKIIFYDPPKSKAYKEHLKKELLANYSLLLPTEKPIIAEIRIYIPIPKSKSKKEKEKMKIGEILPKKKPDVSNYVKLIEDAFNGILYKDDSQIIKLTASKHYSDNPRIEIEIEEL